MKTEQSNVKVRKEKKKDQSGRKRKSRAAAAVELRRRQRAPLHIVRLVNPAGSFYISLFRVFLQKTISMFHIFLLLKLKLGHKLRPYISISLLEAYHRLCLLEWLFWFLASLCYIFFVQQLCFFPHTVWLHQAPALLPHDISIKHNPGKASGKQVFCG